MSIISVEQLQTVVKELPQVLEKMDLMCFGMSINNSSMNKAIKLDIQFINSLNENIKIIQLYGIDLSDENLELFNKFNNLDVLELSKGNINDFKLISNLDSKVGICVSGNPLEKNMRPNDIVAEIRKRKGRINFTYGSIYNEIVIAIAHGKNTISVGDFTVIDDEIFYIMAELTEFEFYINANKIKELRENGVNFADNIKGELIISSTSDLDTKTLEENPEIMVVQIIDEQNSCDSQQDPYTREEFLEIRRRIDEIVEQVKLPEDNDEDREKKIFMQVYQILGKAITYNEYAITEEGKKDERLMITCRNLYDGLVKGTAVCAGYADILRNVLSEFGIKAKYIVSDPMNEEELMDEYGEQSYNVVYKNSHAWNCVILDGKEYVCDLTFDAPNIQKDRYPLPNCCISIQDFQIQHCNLKCQYSGLVSEISGEEQLRLFGFSEEKIQEICSGGGFPLEDFQRMLEELSSRTQLANCVLDASTEIKASDFESIEQSFSTEKEEIKDDKKN